MRVLTWEWALLKRMHLGSEITLSKKYVCPWHLWHRIKCCMSRVPRSDLLVHLRIDLFPWWTCLCIILGILAGETNQPKQMGYQIKLIGGMGFILPPRWPTKEIWRVARTLHMEGPRAQGVICLARLSFPAGVTSILEISLNRSFSSPEALHSWGKIWLNYVWLGVTNRVDELACIFMGYIYIIYCNIII